MSAILRPVRSYANSRSSVLDIDPKLVCKEMQKGLYAIPRLGSNLGLRRKAHQGFSTTYSINISAMKPHTHTCIFTKQIKSYLRRERNLFFLSIAAT